MATIPYGFCQCGCGQPTNIAKKDSPCSFVKRGESFRYLLGHHSRLSPVDYIEDEKTGCWVWQGAIANNYGLKKHNGRMIRAHRFFYERDRGPIPEGLQIDHLCRNKLCVNPSHLEPVTSAVNIRRSRPTTRLTEALAREIRRLYKGGGVSQYALAKRFGVSRGTIYDVVAGKTWRDI